MQHPGVLQLLLEVAQGAGADSGIVTDEARERVHVDVVHPCAGIGLAQLIGQRVEVGELLHDSGRLTETGRLVAREGCRAAPVLAGSERAQIVVEP